MSQCTKPDALKVQTGGNHYSKLKIQPMEFSMANNWDACAHTILKYVTRHQDKNGRQDLEKARHCVDMREALWHQRHKAAEVITISSYCLANQIDTPEESVLCALSGWVWCNSVRTRLEVIVALDNLIRFRYPVVEELSVQIPNPSAGAGEL